jgi:DNA-binding NtrC family response regulator
MAKVLLIEDDQGVRTYITRIIEKAGHEVATAEEGGRGYELAADKSVEMILTDLSMPGEPSEMDLVRKLRALRPDCPTVICSAYPTHERLSECEALGITDFLTKPFEVTFIRSLLDRIFHAPSERTS